MEWIILGTIAGVMLVLAGLCYTIVTILEAQDDSEGKRKRR